VLSVPSGTMTLVQQDTVRKPVPDPVRHIGDDQRRARLGVRHALAQPVDDVEAAARSVVCLHATEPASVHLSASARSGATREDVDRALYVDRSLVKQLAMRRTVFAFPRDLLPAVWGSASARVAGQQLRRMAQEMQATGVAADGDAWAREHLELVRRMIEERGPLTTAAIRTALPTLDARVTRGKGTYQADVAVAGSVVVTLAASGAVVRGENDGGWKISRPRWTATRQWLGDVPDPLPEAQGYAALVTAWLRRFGPGTEADLVWWLGATKAAVRRALADVGAVTVSLDGGAAGWLLPDDLDPVAEPEPWAALLPALDPTTMGWKERAFHLGDHASKVFDRNGNGGPTAWWDGRIVGVWCQRDDGAVEVVLAEDVPRAGRRALDERARALTEWLDGDVVRSIYLSPLAREHLAAHPA
jgi:Winged helix DNA-binding domain